MTLTAGDVLFACTGGGRWSLDHAIGYFDPPGCASTGQALAAGFGGAAALLVGFWRPMRS